MPTPVVTPVASAAATASPTPTNTEIKICRFEDDNANGVHEVGERVLSGRYTLWVTGEAPRIVEGHWWNPLTQGCAITTVPVAKTVTVEEELESGWRHTAVFADGISVAGPSYIYTPTVDQVKVVWFLDTFTPTGGTVAGVTSNTQPECVSLSATPVSGAANLAVNFTGKGRDLDGIIRRFEFNFGDNQTSTFDVSGETNKDTVATMSHTYTQNGAYTASIRVKDNSGQSNEWSTTPESCKVRVDVSGAVIGASTTQTSTGTTAGTTTAVKELPKSGLSEIWTWLYLVSGFAGLTFKIISGKSKTFYSDSSGFFLISEYRRNSKLQIRPQGL